MHTWLLTVKRGICSSDDGHVFVIDIVINRANNIIVTATINMIITRAINTTLQVPAIK